MSNSPNVSTDWNMWDDIEASLEKKKRNRFLPILVGLPFLMILSGVIGYLLAPNSETQISNHIDEHRDTIYITKSINTIDTIIKTEFITKWKNYNSNQQQQLYSQNNRLSSINQSLLERVSNLDSKLNDYRFAFSESILKDSPKYSQLDYLESESTILKSDKFSPSNTERNLLEGLAFTPRLNPNLFVHVRPRIVLINDLWFENLVKNRESQSVLEKIIPDYFNIGLSLETPGLAITKNLSPGLETGIGFNTELLFSPKFSLLTGVRSRSLENKTKDEFIASTYPQPITTPEELFKNLKVKSTFIDIPFSFKYKILKHKKNDLYLTGGVLLSKHKKTEYVYEYIRNTSEIYYEEKFEGGGWNIGSSIVGIGYELDTWKNTSAFIESYARYTFKSDSNAIHGVGFRFGMFYKI